MLRRNTIKKTKNAPSKTATNTQSVEGLILFSDDDDVQTNRDNCSCDNCFYGRNKLALEIIKINDSYSELLQQVMKIYSK